MVSWILMVLVYFTLVKLGLVNMCVIILMFTPQF